jgi:hypothetical protein
MAITFDSASSATPTGGNVNISWNHTVGVGTNSALVVGVANAGTLSSSMACTYNSVSMTSLASKNDGASASSSQMFILKNPTVGTNSVSCTGTSGDYVGQSQSWFGVNQTTPNRTAFTANDGGSGTVSPASVVVSNAISGDVVIDSATAFSVVITVGAGQASQYYVHNPAGNFFDYGSSSISATGSTTMQWTYTGTKFWSEIGFALIPATSIPVDEDYWQNFVPPAPADSIISIF